MRVFEDHQNRLGAGQRLQLQIERFQCALPTLLRRQFECGITPMATN
jgi:hypothetical protein